MPEFLQIVITKKDDNTFHITWQDAKEVVDSEDFDLMDARAVLKSCLVNENFKETPSHRG